MKNAFAIALLLAAAAAAQASDVVIHWSGNRHVSDRNLKVAAARELREFQEHRGPGALQDAAYAVETHYRNRGFALAAVSFDLQPSEASVRTVFFKIIEGPLVRIGEVTFTGLGPERPFSESRLRGFVVVKSGLFRSTPPFKRSDVESARRKIERLYLLDGFLHVRVSKPEYRWSPDNSRVDIAMHVDAGRRYLVRSVEFTPEPANLGIADAVLRGEFALVGKPYHVRLPAESAARLRGWLAQHGHPDAEIDADANIDERTGAVALQFHLTPGAFVRLRSIVIRQDRTARTNASFLRGRFALDEGDVWNQGRIDAGVRDLYRSGLFTKVGVEQVRVDDTRSDLVITAEDAPAKTVSLGAGWGSYEMLRGSARSGDRNVFGTGRAVDAGVDASMRSYGADAGFTDAYSFGPLNTFSVRPSYEFREEPTFDSKTLSNVTELRHDFPGPYALAVGNDYSASEASEITGEIPEAEASGFLRTSLAYADITYDSRNNAIMPSAGALANARLSLSEPVLGSDIAFIEYRAGWSCYQKANADMIGVVGARYITRQLLDEHETLPIQERLFLGGATTVRSFQQDELGPADDDNDPTGGLSSALASVEMRYRLAGNLWGAGFVDVGSVSAQEWNIDWPLGQALGGGLRYVLPVGPIRLDGAYNPGERFAADRSWAVHLSVGFTF